MTDSNIKVQCTYITAHAEAARLIRKLKKQLNDFAAPGEQTNWGHVGDLQAIVSKLREALNEEDGND